MKNNTDKDINAPAICPYCKRSSKDYFINLLGTVECMCGVKFYGKKLNEK